MGAFASVWTAFDARPVAWLRVNQRAGKAADPVRFSSEPPAALKALTPPGARISGKKKGPEMIRALRVGGAGVYRTTPVDPHG
jgi:hypothetical protein